MKTNSIFITPSSSTCQLRLRTEGALRESPAPGMKTRIQHISLQIKELQKICKNKTSWVNFNETLWRKLAEEETETACRHVEGTDPFGAGQLFHLELHWRLCVFVLKCKQMSGSEACCEGEVGS